VLDSAALANGEQFSHISSFQFEENLTRHNKRPQIVHQVHAVGSSQQVQQSDSEKLNILIEETINQMFAGRVHHVLSRMTAGLFEPNTKPEKYNTVNPEIKNTRLKKSLQTKVRHNKSTGQVLVFPARSPKFKNRQVYYLFSLRQVVDVLRQANTQPVPFSPQYVEGIAEWRGRVLPVLSLEQCLGIGMSKEAIPMRTIVVRGAQQSDGNEVHDFYAIFNVGAAVRQYDLPLECKPLAIPQWIANGYCLSGAYQMDKQVLLAINLENVLAIDQTDKPGIVSQERSCIENLL
jgi:chemotaxis signal transduction protein